MKDLRWREFQAAARRHAELQTPEFSTINLNGELAKRIHFLHFHPSHASAADRGPRVRFQAGSADEQAVHSWRGQ